VTLRGRSAFDTQASDESISPDVRAGSGTVQNPLDSMSLLRQCCCRGQADNEHEPGSYQHVRSCDTSSAATTPLWKALASSGTFESTLEESADMRKRAVVGMGVYRGTAMEYWNKKA
jgi:hypothetical protein